MNIIVEIAINEASWQTNSQINNQFDESFFASIAADVLNTQQNWQHCSEVELSVLLTDDAEIKTLNKEFRQQDKATNVLSFPDVNISPKEVADYTPPSLVYLGDIALSLSTIMTEAKSKNISLKNHMHHLVIHAILHLIGYDHIEDSDADIMEAIEIKLLAKYGIESPY